jgi:hypothetical protein
MLSEVQEHSGCRRKPGGSSACPQCSKILPSSMRNISMALTSTRLLVGAIPWNSPLWAPRMVTLAVTLSPSAITPSTLMVRSGKPSRASDKVSLKVSMSLAGLREGVRYRGDRSIDYLLRPVEVPCGDDLIDSPGNGLVLLRLLTPALAPSPTRCQEARAAAYSGQATP